MNKNIEDLTENELKALAYDQLVLLEQTKINIQIIQAELLKRQTKQE